jgi:hypothetical protein
VYFETSCYFKVGTLFIRNQFRVRLPYELVIRVWYVSIVIVSAEEPRAVVGAQLSARGARQAGSPCCARARAWYALYLLLLFTSFTHHIFFHTYIPPTLDPRRASRGVSDIPP